MEGHGVYTWADGRMYIGEYLKSERSGKGRCVFEKWDYEGMWKNDQFHGVGKKTFENGDTYEGDFRQNKMHGKGTYQSKLGGWKYVGDFQGDSRYGTGETIWDDGDKVRGLYLLDKFKEGRFKWNKDGPKNYFRSIQEQRGEIKQVFVL